MSPVYSVTYLAGQDPGTFSHKGRNRPLIWAHMTSHTFYNLLYLLRESPFG